MKTNQKIQLALAGLSLLIMTSFVTQPTKDSFITVRTLEVIGGSNFDSKICIVYEDGKTEDIALESFRNKNFSPNTQKINETLNNLTVKGYTLVFSSSGNGDNVLTNTFIFKK